MLFMKKPCEYVEENYPNNPGELSTEPLYPSDYASSQKWLQDFLEQRFDEFGPFEDAIVASESILHHRRIDSNAECGFGLSLERDRRSRSGLFGKA